MLEAVAEPVPVRTISAGNVESWVTGPLIAVCLEVEMTAEVATEEALHAADLPVVTAVTAVTAEAEMMVAPKNWERVFASFAESVVTWNVIVPISIAVVHPVVAMIALLAKAKDTREAVHLLLATTILEEESTHQEDLLPDVESNRHLAVVMTQDRDRLTAATTADLDLEALPVVCIERTSTHV
jgi:hypothetical protein